MATKHKSYIRTHWVTLLTLAAFVAIFFGVRWIVQTQRSPGSITVVEAQAMNMAAMRAPPGMQPVEAEAAQIRQIGARQSFPATVIALSDEEIVARVPGRVTSLGYPGDQVRRGQIVARIDAQEYLAQAGQSQYTAESSQAQVMVAGREVERRKAAKSQALAGVDAATTDIAKARADQAALVAEQQQMRSEADAKEAMVKDRQASLLYADQDLRRKESLYKDGAISLDQYQASQAARTSAASMVDGAKADAVAAKRASSASAARVHASDQAIEEAKAQRRVAQSMVTTSEKEIDIATAEVNSSRAQSRASSSQANMASVIAGYTQLRALDASMVSERFVSPGSVVTAGQKLLMLHVVSSVRIQAQLPEALASLVARGTPVMIRYGNSVRAAELTSVFPTANPETRTFTAEAIVTNPGHSYLPGSFATMAIQTGAEQSHIAVRTAAIQTDASGEQFVWVVSQLSGGAKTDWTCPMHTQVSEPGPGKCPICKMELVPRTRGGTAVASRRSVMVGSSDGSYTEVTSGLKEGDVVISAGFETLIEGTPVKVALGSGERKATAKSGKELYTCPMHPEVVQDHPGKCPKCGMELVLKKVAK